MSTYEWKMSFNRNGRTLEADSAEYTIYESGQNKSYFFQVPATTTEDVNRGKVHVFFDPEDTWIEWIKEGKIVKSLKIHGKAQVTHEENTLYFWAEGELF